MCTARNHCFCVSFCSLLLSDRGYTYPSILMVFVGGFSLARKCLFVCSDANSPCICDVSCLRPCIVAFVYILRAFGCAVLSLLLRPSVVLGLCLVPNRAWLLDDVLHPVRLRGVGRSTGFSAYGSVIRHRRVDECIPFQALPESASWKPWTCKSVSRFFDCVQYKERFGV